MRTYAARRAGAASWVWHFQHDSSSHGGNPRTTLRSRGRLGASEPTLPIGEECGQSSRAPIHLGYGDGAGAGTLEQTLAIRIGLRCQTALTLGTVRLLAQG